MTPEQFAKLLDMLNKIATKQYTITGAADWEILLVLGAVIGAGIALMWRDLKQAIKDNRVDWQSELARHEANNEKSVNHIWDEIRRCQSDCRKNQNDTAKN